MGAPVLGFGVSVEAVGDVFVAVSSAVAVFVAVLVAAAVLGAVAVVVAGAVAVTVVVTVAVMTRRRKVQAHLDEWTTPAVDPWEGITPSTSTALEVLGVDVCPDCGGVTRTGMWGQGALFWHGGHGGVETKTIRTCTLCPWAMTVAEGTANPRHDRPLK